MLLPASSRPLFSHGGGAQTFYTVRLRDADLPEMTSLRLPHAPREPHLLAPGLNHVAISDPPLPWPRAVDNAEHRLRATLSYLWDRHPDDVLTGDALIEQDLRPGHTSCTVYPGLRLDGLLHHVWPRGTPPSVDVHALDAVVLLQGVCLFSGAAAWATTAAGRRVPLASTRGGGLDEPIIAVGADPRPTVSEVECTLRLGTVCAGLARGSPAACRSSDVWTRHTCPIPCSRCRPRSTG
ncbi:hypothetical protein [Nonomuraea sp. SYSU D8015]|uniref:hypothetical protein n=1 Tax=Nonomuraea sp. SYSU D8015 TaxID=2593644 RepID=UPI00166024BB|nr:hypothetical protein [Nonomuraea sp. SYSU D8015]